MFRLATDLGLANLRVFLKKFLFLQFTYLHEFKWFPRLLFEFFAVGILLEQSLISLLIFGRSSEGGRGRLIFIFLSFMEQFLPLDMLVIMVEM